MPKASKIHTNHWANTATNSGATVGDILWQHWNNVWTCTTGSATTVAEWRVTSTSNTVTTDTWSHWNAKQQAILIQALQNHAAQQATWVSWNTNSVAVNRIENGVVHVTMDAPPPTPEQRAQAERIRAEEAARQSQWREENKRLEAEKMLAKEKAEKLLQSALTPQQREELRDKGYFHCKSNRGSLYRIYRGSHGNVKKIVNGKEVEKYCIQPHYVPEGDCMLAQKLHIEHNEEEFERVANKTRLMN